MSTQPYHENSVQEALLILDDAKNLQTAEELCSAIDMAVQKLRPVSAPAHDAAALAQLEQKYPSQLPWMQRPTYTEPATRMVQVVTPDEYTEVLAAYELIKSWKAKRAVEAAYDKIIARLCAALSYSTQPQNHVPCGECGSCYAGEPCSKLYARHAGGTTMQVVAVGTPSDGGRANCLNSDMPCVGCQKGGEQVC